MLGSYQNRHDFEWSPVPVKGSKGFFEKLVTAYTLTEVLTAVTLLALWGVLVSFVLLISVGDHSVELAIKCKAGLLLSAMLSICTGVVAYLSWSQDRHSGPSRKNTTNRNW